MASDLRVHMDPVLYVGWNWTPAQKEEVEKPTRKALS